jgi:hypothetical protein
VEREEVEEDRHKYGNRVTPLHAICKRIFQGALVIASDEAYVGT